MTRMYFRHSGNPISPCELIYRGPRHSLVQFESGYRKEVNNLRLELEPERVRTMASYRELQFDCDGLDPDYTSGCYSKPDFLIEPQIDVDNRWKGANELATRRSCATHLGILCMSLRDRAVRYTISTYEGR